MTLAPPTLNVEQAIADNLVGRYGFYSWEKSNEHAYAVVNPKMGGARSIFWGYCPVCNTYFISSAIPKSVQIALLQMEHHRLSNNLTHLAAVQYPFSQQSNFPRVNFILSLYAFYSEGGPLFVTEDQLTDIYRNDIEAARDFAFSLVE